MAALVAEIEKQLGSFQLSGRVETRGAVLALLGASGCGKSMMLKCLAGIERPDRGRIVLDGRVLFDSDKHIDLPPQKRRIGYLFQQYALFPNMTVRQNIACTIRDARQREGRTSELIQQMQLTGLEDHYPRQLSGGQQQRTALARILGSEPELLLLDEPFSALDSHLRFQMEQEVRRVVQALDKPVILVSHDLEEVCHLASDIALMREGHIDAIGTRHAIFADPVTRSGAVLTGCKNISPIDWIDDAHVYAKSWGVILRVAACDRLRTCIGIRMHDVRPTGDENRLSCSVAYVVENPCACTVMLRPESCQGEAMLSMELSHAEWARLHADRVTISIPSSAILLLKDE